MRRDLALEEVVVAKYAVVAPALDERARRLWAPPNLRKGTIPFLGLPSKRVIRPGRRIQCQNRCHRRLVRIIEPSQASAVASSGFGMHALGVSSLTGGQTSRGAAGANELPCPGHGCPGTDERTDGDRPTLDDPRAGAARRRTWAARATCEVDGRVTVARVPSHDLPM